MRIGKTLALSAAVVGLASMAHAEGKSYFYRLPDAFGNRPQTQLVIQPVLDALFGGTVVSKGAIFLSDAGARTLSVGDGHIRLCDTSACAGDSGWSKSVEARTGDVVQVRADGPTVPSQTIEIPVTTEGFSTDFRIVARSAAASFGAIPKEEGLAGAFVESELSTFHGWVSTEVSIDRGEYRVCPSTGGCGAYTSVAGTIRDGDQVQVRLTAAASGSVEGKVSAGGAAVSFVVDTLSADDTTPDDFEFEVPGGSTLTEPGEWVVSSKECLTGHTGLDVSITGGEYRVCPMGDCSGATWTSAATADVEPGACVQIRVKPTTFAETVKAVLTAGTKTAEFSATSRDKDERPAAFSFTALHDQEPAVVATSNEVTLSSFDGAAISIVDGEYSLNSGSWTSTAGTAAPGDLVRVRLTTGPLGERRTTTLTVGGTSASFAATTRAKDETPDAFSLGTGPTDVEPSSVSTSQTATLAGFDDARVSISGEGATYSLNGGEFTTTQATVVPGDTVAVRLVASSEYGIRKNATLSVGTRTVTWSSTTRSLDLAPDPITFASTKGHEPGSEVLSEIRPLTGHDGIDVSVSGTDATLRICSVIDCGSGTVGSWTTSASNVAAGSYVQLRQIAGALDATLTPRLSYGTRSTTWEVASAVDPVAKGVLYAVGDNVAGQLGTGSTGGQLYVISPVAMPAGVSTFSRVSTSFQTTCAIGSDAQAYCWGGNAYGQVGDNTTTAKSSPTLARLPTGVVGFKDMSVGSYFACAIGSDDQLYCWGRNDKGQIGQSSTANQRIPLKVAPPAGATGYTAVVAGDSHTCGRASDGDWYCWGENNYGQLGNNTTSSGVTYLPSKLTLPGATAIKKVTLGKGVSCALGADDQAYCWGYGADGSLGSGGTANLRTPAKVQLPDGVVSWSDIVLRSTNPCAVGSDGTTWCWGLNDRAQLGTGASGANSSIPVKIPVPTALSSLEVKMSGRYHACANGSDDETWCWGWNFYGNVAGNATNTGFMSATKPILPEGISRIESAAAGQNTSYFFVR